MSKKELELYELVVLFKFTTVEETTQERIDFYKNFIITNILKKIVQQ